MKQKITVYLKIVPLVFAGVLSTAPYYSGGEVVEEVYWQSMIFQGSHTSEEFLSVANDIRSVEYLSSFDITRSYEYEAIPYETEEEYTDDLYYSESEVVVAGEYGQITRIFDVYYWNGEEYDRTLVDEATTEPITEQIRIGTRKQYYPIETEQGTHEYFQILSMWATSYDGNCPGCTNRTYLGTAVTHGVCAVDPRVIPLGSAVYVPGYGVCRAEDIGGAIKGNVIDLGFEDVHNGWWSSRYTDVYLLK